MMVQRAAESVEPFERRTEEEVAIYVGLAIILGEGFEQNDRYAWMGPILRDTRANKFRRISDLLIGRHHKR